MHLIMQAFDKLCRLCADDLDVSILMENFGDLAEIPRILNFVNIVYFLLRIIYSFSFVCSNWTSLPVSARTALIS